MAFSIKRTFLGVCGNFRFRFYTITDVQDTISIFDTAINVLFCNSTNETDAADIFNAKPLAWSSACDTDVSNEIKDTTVTMNKALQGLQAWNQTDSGDDTSGYVDYKDGDELNAYKDKYASAARDICPTGDETYLIQSKTHIQMDTASSDDDGTLIVFGR